MDSGAAVGGGWSLVKHKRLPVAIGFEGTLEKPLGFPGLEQVLLHLIRTLVRPRRKAHAGRRSTTPDTSRVSEGSARLATAMIFSRLAGSRASGRHWSVMIEIPSTFIPSCTATMTSGTVDIPTTSAPIARSMRYSARVSRFGPVTAT